MKMTRRNFLSTSAVAALACGASLTAHAAGSTDENSLNFITDIFKDPTQPGEIEEATAITAEKNAEWYEKLDFSDRRELDNAARGLLDNQEGRVIYNDDGTTAWDLQGYGDLDRDAPDTVNPSLWRNTQLNAKAVFVDGKAGVRSIIPVDRPLCAPRRARENGKKYRMKNIRHPQNWKAGSSTSGLLLLTAKKCQHLCERIIIPVKITDYC